VFDPAHFCTWDRFNDFVPKRLVPVYFKLEMHLTRAQLCIGYCINKQQKPVTIF
jgi:hypothetical protein